ncbi:hypothetical protein Peur_061813 [Populus x canadensis]
MELLSFLQRVLLCKLYISMVGNFPSTMLQTISLSINYKEFDTLKLFNMTGMKKFLHKNLHKLEPSPEFKQTL